MGTNNGASYHQYHRARTCYLRCGAPYPASHWRTIITNYYPCHLRADLVSIGGGGSTAAATHSGNITSNTIQYPVISHLDQDTAGKAIEILGYVITALICLTITFINN